MRSLARTSLGLLGLALIAPMGAGAQDVSSMPTAPAGYQAAPSAAVGQPMPAAPAPPEAAQPAPHNHTGRVICARCAAKEAQARNQANMMPPPKYVGCAHSKNGVCTACQRYLEMPGQVVVMGTPVPAPAPEAPGRAVASSGPSASAANIASRSGMAPNSYDGPSGDPTPVGVVQANYVPVGPSGMPASSVAPGSQPGRAVAESDAGHDPYQKKSGGFPHPHILGHLFGWSGLGAEKAEEKARRKAEAHAMISYDSNGVPSTSVEELPASAVYGKKGR